MRRSPRIVGEANTLCFTDPNGSGLSEAWGAATVARLRQMLEARRKEPPL